MRADLKTGLLVCALLGYFGSANVLHLAVHLGFGTRSSLVWLTQFICRMLMAICGVRVRIIDPKNRMPAAGAGTLLVANHISYLDALILMWACPAAFITSVETGETLGLGHLTRAAGCAFVERRRRLRVLHDLNAVTSLLLAGNNVVLFPEATTSEGLELLPFKSALLESAFQARTTVLPVCVRYCKIDGERFQSSNKDCIAWYGDMRFWPHLRQLMKCREIEVEVTLLEPLAFRCHRDRKRMAQEAQSAIAEAYRSA